MIDGGSDALIACHCVLFFTDTAGGFGDDVESVARTALTGAGNLSLPDKDRAVNIIGVGQGEKILLTVNAKLVTVLRQSHGKLTVSKPGCESFWVFSDVLRRLLVAYFAYPHLRLPAGRRTFVP